MVSERDLDGVVEGLDALFATSAFDLAYKSGEFLLQKLYRGDLEYFRTSGRQHVGYRRLLAHPRLRLSPTALWRSLRVYDLCQRFPWLNDCPKLRVTHLYAVLGLPESTQEALLREAADRGLDVGRIEELARPLREIGGRGRPRSDTFDRAVRYLKQFLEHSPTGSTKQLERSEADELRQLVTAVRSRLEDLEAAMLSSGCA